jgi:DNA polymerase-3 subunit gamma/tau
MCARILLPGVDGNVESLGARLARLERRLSVPDSARPHPAAPVPQPAGTTSARQPAPSTAPDPADTSDAAGPSGPADATPTGSLSLVDVRQLWPGVLDRVKVMRRFAWMVLSQNASVKDARDGILTLAFGNDGARKSFLRSGNDEIVRQALIDELGVDWQIETIVDGPTTTVATPRPSTASRFSSPTDHRPEPSAYAATGAQSAHPGAAEIVSDDDEVLDDSASSQELLERELGAKVIDDIRHDAV